MHFNLNFLDFTTSLFEHKNPDLYDSNDIASTNQFFEEVGVDFNNQDWWNENTKKKVLKRLQILTDNNEAIYQNLDFDYLECMLSAGKKYMPSERRNYNNHDYQLLALGLERATNQDLYDYADKSIFSYLRLQAFSKEDWPDFPKISKMGVGFQSITMQDLARFGYLFLRKGRWEDIQLFHESDIFEMTQEGVVKNESEKMSQNFYTSLICKRRQYVPALVQSFQHYYIDRHLQSPPSTYYLFGWREMTTRCLIVLGSSIL